MENALSWWTSLGNDGPAVERSRAAGALSLQVESGATRNVYTYTGTQALLTDASNGFVTANTAITNAMLQCRQRYGAASPLYQRSPGSSGTSSIQASGGDLCAKP
jgi:hypothetical protein